ncbi:MAG TPA: hypothetical protein VJJ81_02235 [Candidatus Babeliales bacterium]|nr:hypothetical protein [Candidatus Babeliales bacterium]
MFYWRITKYNPKNRDINGSYLLDEWTCYSQVDTITNGKLLTYAEYLVTENAYVKAINLFMICNDLKELQVAYLEKYWELDQDFNLNLAMIELFKRMKIRRKLSMDEVEIMARLVLRRKLWCKLGNENTMFVHFGYDYYMYIGSAKKCVKTIRQIQQSGLFVEEFLSPYLEE